ncbi:MAG TPA: hypothetical protein PLJ62_00800 [Thermoflexales bacterium]|nr:hypothetical protein [Thermoflexales bacterium]HQW35356.1 hypothetical protein [Thermoflexales bacterium]HQZ98712.1 hypothetical protein [Thermoflexales bacterium]
MSATKFAAKTLALLMAVILTMLGLMRLIPPAISISEADYLSATNQKHALLAKTASPKIVLVGGSGLALGVDSEKIQNNLNRPVVNMGLYAGLGLRVMLDEVRPYIRAGDVIYITPEYQLYYRETRRSDDAIATLVQVSFPQSMAYLPATTHLHALTAIWNAEQKALGNAITRKTPPQPATSPQVEYFREGFNAHGDYVAHLGKPGLGADKINALKLSYQENLTFDPDSIAALNDFADFAKSRGATAILAFPVIPEQLYTNDAGNRALLDALYQTIQRDAKMTITGSPPKSLLPASDFYDTIYHLNDSGRAKYTAQIVAALRVLPNAP